MRAFVAAGLDRAPSSPGLTLEEGGAQFVVFSRNAISIDVCLFEQTSDCEFARWRLGGRHGDLFQGFIPDVAPGARYGLRAHGPLNHAAGQAFDVSKLLIDPYATRLDRACVYDVALSRHGIDTAAFVPRAIVEAPVSAIALRAAASKPNFIYELNVRAFSMQNLAVPEAKRGTLAGLADPASIAHLVRLGVSHVELMPIHAWVDERHLAPLGLTNGWGYNTISFMALDPRLAPNGMADLREACLALRAGGIGVLLDVVFNHTGEGDMQGPVLSFRGLDNASYYRHATSEPGALVNDTGCGNTLACDRAPVVQLLMDSMRRSVEIGGVEGFRFDLAPVLVRSDSGFSPEAPLLTAIVQDPVLKDRVLIAEPWDTGPGAISLEPFLRVSLNGMIDTGMMCVVSGAAIMALSAPLPHALQVRRTCLVLATEHLLRALISSQPMTDSRCVIWLRGRSSAMAPMARTIVTGLMLVYRGIAVLKDPATYHLRRFAIATYERLSPVCFFRGARR